MDPKDPAVFRCDQGPVITVEQITEHEVRFRFVAYIVFRPLVVLATATPSEFQELLTNLGYRVYKIRDHATDVTVEDLVCLGISPAQGGSDL